jgi:hypothetical protein
VQGRIDINDVVSRLHSSDKLFIKLILSYLWLEIENVGAQPQKFLEVVVMAT